MPSAWIWVPESEYDRDAIQHITDKVIQHFKIKLSIGGYGSKQGYNDVARKPDGLKKAVQTYLKRHEFVIFLIDADSKKSQEQRRREPNSYVRRIEEVANTFQGKVILIPIRQEIESWLLIDCLGICCYYTKNPETRTDQDWIKFAQRKQRGKTDLIEEANLGGNNAKEYLEKLSEKILIKKNTNLKKKYENLRSMKYREAHCPEIAKSIEINDTTIKRNDSLKEYQECLGRLSKVDLDGEETQRAQS